MSDDILADWKTRRFIITGLDISPPHIIILCDITYWTENYDEFGSWCNKNGCELSGMTVTIPSDEILTLFIVRWS